MKYYRLIGDGWSNKLEKGKIYPADFETGLFLKSVEYYSKGLFSYDWEEVTESEYLLQENEGLQKGIKEIVKVLPEKWCVKADGVDGEIGKWFNTQSGNKCYGFTEGYYHRYNSKDEDITIKGIHSPSFHNSIIRKDYTEITADELKKCFLMKENKNKIIGYETPTDLWGGDVKKGTIYVSTRSSKNYYPKDNDDKDLYMPREVVEQWEPVYEKEIFNVGDWVVIDNLDSREGTLSGEIGHVGRITRVSDSWDTFYHLEPHCTGGCWPAENLVKASEIQIKNALIEEAKKRGFVKGAKFDCILTSRKDCTVNSEEYQYHVKEDWLSSVSSSFFYSKGKWAKIIIPKITIKGYEAVFKDNTVSFGCQKYTKDFVLKLNECLEENDFAMEIRDEIAEVAKRFKE